MNGRAGRKGGGGVCVVCAVTALNICECFACFRLVETKRSSSGVLDLNREIVWRVCVCDGDGSRSSAADPHRHCGGLPCGFIASL